MNSIASHNIAAAIGNTPLIKLEKIVPSGCADVYVKLEYLNPTGCYKDRMALAIIEEAEKRGTLRPGMTVVECTAGSTGTSLAFVCTIKGYHFKVISSDVFAKEKLQAMRLFGAELELVPGKDGKITPDLIPRMIEMAREMGNSGNVYWTNQFENRDAIEGYRTMGKEILQQLNKPVDVFCGAVGTAGMITGVSKELKEANSNTKVIVLEPASAPLITQGVKGSHKVDGIGVGFVPPMLDKANYDEAMAVEEQDARQMAKLLATKEGIFAGTSSGLNISAALSIAKKLGPGRTVVTVACDSGMKYMSSGLFD